MDTVQFNVIVFLLCILFTDAKENIFGLEKNIIVDIKITESCKKSILEYASALLAEEKWALRMANANGKISSQILDGSTVSLGSYDECIKVKSGLNMRGKYCFTTVSSTDLSETISKVSGFNLPENIRENSLLANLLFVYIGTCFPETCTANDVAKITKRSFEATKYFSKYTNLTITLDEKRCSTEDPIPWNNVDYAAICVISVILFITVISTCYDLSGKKKTSKSPLLSAFSFFANSRKLLKINENPGPLASLNGIRILSMCWMLVAHRFIPVSTSNLLVNLPDYGKFFNSYESPTILGATLAVDTFLVMSGVLLSYVFFTKYEKDKKINMTLFYAHRFLRLLPALALMTLMNASLFKHFGSGPIWYNTGSIVEMCEKYWWTTLLFINNYAQDRDLICIGQSWYLSVDMQLFLLSPLLLFPLIWKPVFGIIWASFCTIAFIVSCVILSIKNNWTAGVVFDGYNDYYYATHTRGAPYVMGIIAGYFLVKNKKFKMSKTLAILGWILSFAIMIDVIFAIQDLQTFQKEGTRVEHVGYLSFGRPVWSLGILWMIFSNFYGYGGPINKFLSLNIFQVPARLTFSIYLIHYQMQMMMVNASKVPLYFSAIYIFFETCGDFAWILFFAYLITVLVESPVVNIEKILMNGKNDKAAEINNQKFKESSPVEMGLENGD